MPISANEPGDSGIIIKISEFSKRRLSFSIKL